MSERKFTSPILEDTGERILPTQEGEISLVYSRHRFAYQYVQQFISDKNVIDIGCGTGYGCKLMSESAKRVVGIDYDKSAIEYCQKKFGSSNIEFRHLNAASLDLNEQFDVAVSFQVIEHIQNLSDFIERIKRIIKPDGIILLSTPNVKGKEDVKNPFHCNEMDYDHFSVLLHQHFNQFKILGVAHASPNTIRSLIQKLPFYRWGRILKRNSRIKRIASNVMDLTEFHIIDTDVDTKAIDLLAVCTNK